MWFYSMTSGTNGLCTHNAVADALMYGIDLTSLHQLGRLDQVTRSTMSTIEDSTTFSISMCFNSSTMYFQVHGTGILVAVVLAV